MSGKLNSYHPRHFKSPHKFAVGDKALLLNTKTRVLLLAETSINVVKGDPKVVKEPITNTLGLSAVIDKVSPSISSKDLLSFFDDKQAAYKDNSASLHSLVKLLNEGRLSLYRWPYGMVNVRSRPPGHYDAAASAPSMPKLNTLKKVGGYIAPFVPTLAQLDELASKAEALRDKVDSLRNMDKDDLKRMAMNEVSKHIPDEAKPVLDLVNNFAAGVANGVDTKALAKDTALGLVGMSLNGQAALPIDQTKSAGEPISLVTGEELLKLTDFEFNGPLPLAWWRVYRSSNPQDNGLGHGWSHSLNEWLSIDHEQQRLQLHDAEGRLILLPLPAVGERSHNTIERLSVLRQDEDSFVITPYSSPYGLRRYFEREEREEFEREEREEGNNQRYFLSAIKNSHNAGYSLHREAGRLTEVRSSQGDKLLLDYTRCGHIAALSRQDSQGQRQTLISYRYNTSADLIQTSDADGYGEAYRYENHIITRRQLKSGYNFYFEWDQLTPEARCIRQWGQSITQNYDGDGPQSSPGATYDYRFKWDKRKHQVTVTDTLGAQETYRHNEQAKLIYHRDAEGHETFHLYNDLGQQTQTIYPDGSEDHYQYNDGGQLVLFTNNLGHTRAHEWDEEGRLSAVTYNGSDRWQYQYNDHNQITEITNPEGQVTQYTYNALGLVGTVTHADVLQVRYWWNERGQLTQEKNTAGHLSQYTYNAQQQLSQVQHANGHSTYYTYNVRGQVDSITGPDGNTTHYTYTELGYLETVTDATGTQTTYEYDGLSQVSQRTITDAQGHTSTLAYEYDGERNLIGLRNEKNERYQLAYDKNERLTREVGFDGRTTEYQYNALGHVIQQREYGNANDNDKEKNSDPLITDYERNALGQVLSKRNPDGTTYYEWNSQGQMTLAQNAHRSLRWTYNRLGQVIEAWQDQAVIKYQYNDQGRLHFTQLPNNDILHWLYYPSGQLHGVFWTYLNDAGKVARKGLLEITYRDDGQERTRRHLNGLITVTQQDAQGRLSEKSIAEYVGKDRKPHEALVERLMGGSKKDYRFIHQAKFDYSPLGQLTDIRDSYKGDTHYHYDALDRLTQVDGPNPEHIIHDPAHNLLAIDSEPSKAESQAQQSQIKHNRLEVQGDQQFKYDPHGNRTHIIDPNGDTTELRYNAEHQLIAVKNQAGITLYTYDALGRRVNKIHQDPNNTATKTNYLWEGDNLFSETSINRAGDTLDQQHYIFEPNTHKPIALLKGRQAYRYHLDHLGTPDALTDEKGHLVWMASYSSYGKLANSHEDEVLKQYQDETGRTELPDVRQPFRFQGQYFDEETGLHYNRHRYYDPNTGSFLTQDPIKLAGGINNYQYVPNPISWVDPLGLINKEACGGMSFEDKKSLMDGMEIEHTLNRVRTAAEVAAEYLGNGMPSLDPLANYATSAAGSYLMTNLAGPSPAPGSPIPQMPTGTGPVTNPGPAANGPVYNSPKLPGFLRRLPIFAVLPYLMSPGIEQTVKDYGTGLIKQSNMIENYREVHLLTEDGQSAQYRLGNWSDTSSTTHLPVLSQNNITVGQINRDGFTIDPNVERDYRAYQANGGDLGFHGWISEGMPLEPGEGEAQNKASNTSQRIAKLDLEGHAPVRHGGPNRVTDLQLEDRAVRGIDPASGTPFDAFNKFPDGSPKPHKVGRNATAFTSDEALLTADDFARSSSLFQENIAEAKANGEIFADPVEIPLKDVFGNNYQDSVRGVTRLGSKNNPTGHVATDFTDGTIKAIYRLDENGNPKLHTLYPNPKP